MGNEAVALSERVGFCNVLRNASRTNQCSFEKFRKRLPPSFTFAHRRTNRTELLHCSDGRAGPDWRNLAGACESGEGRLQKRGGEGAMSTPCIPADRGGCDGHGRMEAALSGLALRGKWRQRIGVPGAPPKLVALLLPRGPLAVNQITHEDNNSGQWPAGPPFPPWPEG
jgi:hypothetical protein